MRRRKALLATPLPPLETGLATFAVRIFQLGNSPHCFDVLRALYRFSGVGLFHETHLHHMIRHCCMERGLLSEYRRELRFRGDGEISNINWF